MTACYIRIGKWYYAYVLSHTSSLQNTFGSIPSSILPLSCNKQFFQTHFPKNYGFAISPFSNASIQFYSFPIGAWKRVHVPDLRIPPSTWMPWFWGVNFIEPKVLSYKFQASSSFHIVEIISVLRFRTCSFWLLLKKT